MVRTLLLVCLFSTGFLISSSSMFAQTTPLSRSSTVGNRPQRGLLVTYVFPDSPAEDARLQSYDLITQYGEYEIVDDATFFAARNRYEEAHLPSVEIIVWRRSSRISASVRPGWLGITSVENDPVSKQFQTLMNRLKAMNEIPEYMHDHEFKGQFDDGQDKILEKAKTLIDQAEREKTLTPEQILVNRIYMVLDDASVEDQKHQSMLLKQLIESQPVNYIHMLGNDKFFQHRRHRAAAACFEQYLKSTPDDVSIRLNLGIAYNRLGMYRDAERAANYVFDHKLGLSNFGFYIAYTVKSASALGRKDYSTSIEFAERAFAIEPKLYPSSLVQLAAAQTGDLKKVDEAIRQFREAHPAMNWTSKLQMDAVKAYALVKANQIRAARQLVREWTGSDRPEGRITHYWRQLPDGLDVARNWANLIEQDFSGTLALRLK